MKIPWTEFKAFIATRQNRFSFIEYTDRYILKAVDSGIEKICVLYRNTVPAFANQDSATALSWTSEFESKFKALGNQPTPMSSDGRPVLLPTTFPGWVTMYITSRGDSTTVRGGGISLQLTRDLIGTSTLEFSFMDAYYLAAGRVQFQGAELGDHISLEAYAPATALTSTPGAGNVNIVSPGGGAPDILIVPAVNGSHTLDYSTAIPVPAYDEWSGISTGAWEWNDPLTGSGTVSPVTSGRYNLYSIPINLARFVNELSLLGSGGKNLGVENIKSKYMLPQWKLKVSLYNSGHLGLKVSWDMVMARFKTL